MCVWDNDGGKSRDATNLRSLGTAPARAPQNLHAIRTDSGLIVEWEEVIPEDPGEGPLGPYKLSWVQENGTQVRETALSPCLLCWRVWAFYSPREYPPPPGKASSLSRWFVSGAGIALWPLCMQSRKPIPATTKGGGWGSGAQIKLCLQLRLW